MRKIYSIYEINFLTKYFGNLIENECEILDPFKLVLTGIECTNDYQLKEDLIKEFYYYNKSQYYKEINSTSYKTIEKDVIGIDNNRQHEAEYSQGSINHDHEGSLFSSGPNSNHDGESQSDKDSETGYIDYEYSVDDQEPGCEATHAGNVQIDIIHEWLFSEEVPFFNKNDYVKQWITCDEDLEIFFRIILSPFRYKLHPKAIAKYKKLTQNLNLDFKQTYPANLGFVYRPDKHNTYYQRSRRMMIIFLFKPNISTLMRANSRFVDVFYKVFKVDVLDNEKTRVNMEWCLKLIQYFILTDVSSSIKNIIKYNIPYYLLGNIDIFSAKLTLNCQLVPGDKFFKIPQPLLEQFYKYLARTNFWQFYVNMFLNYNQKLIADKIKKLSNTTVKFDKEEFNGFQKGVQKNPILNLYHSFFNIKLLIRNHKQPEDYGIDKKDIDRIDLLNIQSNLDKKKDRGVLRKRFSSILEDTLGVVNNTLFVPGGGNSYRKSISQITTYQQLDSTTENFTNPLAGLQGNFKKMGMNLEKIEKSGDTIGAHANQGPSLEFIEDDMLANMHLETQKQRHGILDQTISHLMLTGRFQFSKHMRITRKSRIALGLVEDENSDESNEEEIFIPIKPCKETSGIIRMKKVVRAIMLAKRFKVIAKKASIMKQQKSKSTFIFNKMVFTMYNEKIKTISPDMAKLLDKQDDKYEYYCKTETCSKALIEVLSSVIYSCTDLLNPERLADVNLPVRDPSIFWDLVMQNKFFMVNLFENFLTKINFGLENKTQFHSTYVTGQIMIHLIKIFPKIMSSNNIRFSVVTELKRHISQLCFYVNKSHKIYRMRDKTDSIKLPGSITIQPQTDLRILITETLFTVVAADYETGYECLNKIHDSTYHQLFIFAMEKCHNNIYLSKFLKFCTILFRYGSELTILNAVVKINLLSDFSNFFQEFVHKEGKTKPHKELFMWFFRELYSLMQEATEVSLF